MHGDFEAQRHWMELTQHLPVKEWYHYDLPYWGLDYPPLTAYHSQALGLIGSMFDKSWFALEQSRGNENYDLVFFMRHSVLASEYVTYIPAVLLFAYMLKISTLERTTAVILVLLQPALLLIDHGHFQYNSVMLGFFVYSLYFLAKGRIYAGAICYVCCLSFKQMGLYYSPAIFTYLLSLTCRSPRKFVMLSLTTGLAFALCFGPIILAGGVEGGKQVLVRMFPFARGLFEDKVANFWCSLNVIYKLRDRVDATNLQRLSLTTTVLSVLPACFMLFRKPTARILVLSTASCAWGFFLFSFQVHEKSVLLPLTPSTLLLLIDSVRYRGWVGYLNIVATFSLWPLLKKDGLHLQYFILTGFWIWLGAFWRTKSDGTIRSRMSQSLQLATYGLIVVLHVLEPFVKIQGKPDLFVVLNVLLCTPVFGMFYFWTLWQLTNETRHA